MKRSLVIALAFVFFVGAPVQAQQIFFGEDLGASGGAPLTNSIAAETQFLSFLTGVGTETFDVGFTDGQTGPLSLTFPGAGTATLQGTGEIEDDPGAGRFAISDPNWWEVDVTTGSFYIDFTNPVAAFGFYGIDVGDFAGQLQLTFMSGGTSIPVLVPHSVEGIGGVDPEGAAFFYGYINTANPFTQVVFQDVSLNSYGSETFGFDNMTIGSVEQVVPEPGTVILLGTGLLALGGIAYRRREEEE